MIAFFVTASSSSSSWYFPSYWDLGPLSQHHYIKDMLPMKIYPDDTLVIPAK